MPAVSAASTRVEANGFAPGLPAADVVDGCRLTWKVDIIEGYASDLAAALAAVHAANGTIRFVLPNGINRWTVVYTVPA